MARSKRRTNVLGNSPKAKKSRSSDQTSDDDAMDVDHTGLDHNVIEQPGQSDGGLMHENDAGSDVSSSDEGTNVGGSENDPGVGSNSSDEDPDESACTYFRLV
mmetsp:Transcript_26790/g.38822  ORF Transcript_26790/g.38822 Transcript_26790/m.38822 type:complete len:103 (+) Transcript_26790:126-434(+)